MLRQSSRPLLALLIAVAFGCAAQQQAEPAPRLSPAPLSVAVPAPFDPGGVGSLEARRGSGDTSQLRLTSVHVEAQQRGDMAEIAATHTFRNDSDEILEGTFRFPMPDGALLTGLAMMIDGKLMEGELVEREKARKVYEEIVDGMQDPALLEWEHGTTFKMRVFPIEARREKVVTIRYLAPLRRTGDKLELVQAVRSAGSHEPLPALRIDWQGKRVLDEQNVAADRVVAFAAQPASAVLREQRPDGSYAIVRVSPDWSQVPASKAPLPKTWFVVLDTSRSALEEQPRQLEALGAALAALPKGARFQLIASDLDARPAATGLAAATPEAISRAVDFAKSIIPDGASDLGRALELVGELAKSEPNSAVLYLGDCEPTWGVTETDALLELQRQKLPSTPFFAMTFGASVNDDLAAALAHQSGGRRARVKRREDLDAFVKTLAQRVPVLSSIQVQAAPGSEVLSNGPLSIEQGRELLLVVKAAAGRDPLAGLTVKAKVGGQELNLLPKAVAQETPGVSRRFGAALVRKLEQSGSAKPEIVSASLAYGVMSKLTSFLVLESEEAYARFAIERKSAQAADAPRVTGANLENTDDTAISADRIQPGDPEIYIDAARDALSVKVEFPFGETKTASYDPEARGGRGAWMVRFLVARDTPEGDYDALAHVQHRDGRIETQKVRYTVDNTAPELDIELEPSSRQPGTMVLTVTQPDVGPLSDLKRVEIRTPAGTIYQLTAIRWGTFRAFIPRRELVGGTLRVVGFDQALNHRVKELPQP